MQLYFWCLLAEAKQQRKINNLVEGLLPWLDKELYANLKREEGNVNFAFEEMRSFFEAQSGGAFE